MAHAPAKPMLCLDEVTPDTLGFDALCVECDQQGHRMLARFAESWRDGSNRFDRTGERIVGAYLGGRLVGLCGRNRDPYDSFARAGRVRHLYVGVAHRRTGVGRALLDSIIEDAVEWFDYLNTNCPPEAAAFYERLGFVPVSAPHVTHRLVLKP
jgi:GNAT superfamily N-acetyltransferase